ncbi:MAG TPA: DUF2188 domain-containing protein [Solirubrobacterales bacterium]|nr:DUF2188 domain-containing protein [Solirubrobacterales bacterium]
MSDFEVVRSDVEGWDVRRTGEAQALSNYPTRELAEQAARKQQEAEHSSGGTADAIDVRQDVFSEGPEEELDVKRTLLGVVTITIGVILLIAIVATFVVVTGITE